jgi:hypothetical protein
MAHIDFPTLPPVSAAFRQIRAVLLSNENARPICHNLPHVRALPTVAQEADR